MIRISIAEEGGDPRLLTFNKAEVSIGRSPTSDLCLTGKGVSGNHCRLMRLPQGVVVEDTGSTNGTYVNHQRLSAAQLVGPQDEIVVARYLVRILDQAQTTAGIGPVGAAAPFGQRSATPGVTQPEATAGVSPQPPNAAQLQAAALGGAGSAGVGTAVGRPLPASGAPGQPLPPPGSAGTVHAGGRPVSSGHPVAGGAQSGSTVGPPVPPPGAGHAAQLGPSGPSSVSAHPASPAGLGHPAGGPAGMAAPGRSSAPGAVASPVGTHRPPSGPHGAVPGMTSAAQARAEAPSASIPMTSAPNGAQAVPNDPSRAAPSEADVLWAREWEKIDSLTRSWLASGKDSARLLRGAKLKHARKWLASGRGKQPAPKREHRDFIVAGTWSKQFRILRNVSVAGVVLGGLSFAGLRYGPGLWVEAQPVEDDAGPVVAPDVPKPVDTSQIRAMSDKIAVTAQGLVERDAAAATLVAAQGLRLLRDGAPRVRGSNAEIVFRQAVARLKSRALRGHRAAVGAVAVSKDGRYVYTGSGTPGIGSVRQWDLTSGALVESSLMSGHTNPVFAMVITPDGKFLFTAANERRLLRWTLGTREALPPSTFLSGHTAPVTALALSGDGRWLFTGDESGVLRTWDATTATPTGSKLEGHDGKIVDIAVNDAGTRVISASSGVAEGREDEGEGDGESAATPSVTNAILWRVDNGVRRRKTRLKHGDQAVTAVGMAPDARWALTGTAGGEVRLWDPNRSATKSERLLEQHTAAVTQIDVTPDSVFAVTAGEDDTVAVWTIDNRDPVKLGGSVFNEHRGDITALVNVVAQSYVEAKRSIRPVHLAVTASQDATVRTWNLDLKDTRVDSQQLADHRGPVQAVAVSGDHQWIVSGGIDKTARVWDHQSRLAGGASKLARGHKGPVLDVALAGAYRMMSVGLDKKALLWNLDTKGELELVAEFLDHDAPVTAVAIRGDAKYAITGDERGALFMRDLLPEDPAKPNRLPLVQHTAEIKDIQWSRYDERTGEGGRVFVTTDADGVAVVWRLSRDPRESFEKLEHDDIITNLAVGPNGRFVLTATPSGPRLWDLDAGSPPKAKRLRGHESDISAVAIGHKAKWAATASDDPPLVQLWDLNTKKRRAKLRKHEEGVDALAFSPDGRWLASGSRDASIRLWAVNSKEPASGSLPLRGHEASVTLLAFSPDSKWLYSASGDQTIRVWNMESGEAAAITKSAMILGKHGNAVSAMELAGDGSFLVSGSWDQTARLWPLTAEGLVPIACMKAGRDLTDDEWERYIGGAFKSLCR